jgi:hypothetical protein
MVDFSFDEELEHPHRKSVRKGLGIVGWGSAFAARG